MIDVEMILKIAQRHELFSKMGLCCTPPVPCEKLILLEEIKRLDGLVIVLLDAVALLQQPRGDDDKVAER